MAGQSVVIDWTINVGNLLTICGFMLGGMMFVLAIRSDVNSIKMAGNISAERLKNVELELKQMSQAMLDLARQDERLKYAERRIAAIEGRQLREPADVSA